jgi:hydrophobic/amphiphilic exporter-1 (mainly G- bacteria), HAE1 family
MNITRLSIERPTLLAVFYILIVLSGIYCFFSLSYELIPQFNPPVITVVTIYPGASPKEVEQEVTVHLEDALSSLEGVETITANSSDNFSLVKLELKANANVDKVLQNASRKLLSVVAKLPSDARPPVLTRFDFNDLPIIRIAAFSDEGILKLTKFCKETVISTISQINGVANVDITGGVENEVMISVDADRLKLNNVSLLQVLKAVGQANKNFPAGSVESNDLDIPVEMKGRYKTLEDIRNLVIFKNVEYGITVKIKDVAEVFETQKPVQVFSRLNGKPAIGLSIKKQSDANSVEISDQVIAALLKLEKIYSKENLTFEFIQDNSDFTKAAAHSVALDLVLAIILVSLVLLLFLHNFRNALIVFVSIPISILATFVVMYYAGYSLNLLTLLGLTLSIGILVDDSIVILENISRHLKMGKSPRQAAYEGRMEIGFTAISITLIDVIVFVPIIMAKGMVADMLRPFSVVLVASTLMSLIVSFTLVPFLASRFSSTKQKHNDLFFKFSLWVEELINNIINEIIKGLSWSFMHAKLVLLSAFLIFVGSILFIPAGFIGIEFTKGGDRSEFIMELELDQNASLQESNQIAKQVEDILKSYKDVETIFTNVGLTSSGQIISNSQYLSEIYVKLRPKKFRNYKTTDFSRYIKFELMKKIPGLKVRPVEINLVGLRDDDAVQVTLTGSNSDSVLHVAQKVYAELESIPGAIELQSNIDVGKRIISVTPNREAMELLDIDVIQAGITLRTAINGMEDFQFKNEDKDLPIQIILNENFRNSVNDIQNLTVLNNSGASIPFREFAEIRETYVSSNIERMNRAPSITIKSQVIGRPAGTISNILKSKIKALKLSPDINLIWGGATKRTRDGLFSLILAFVISILLIYLVLVALYNSFSYPLVVLFSIPLAVIGAFLSLALNMEALSIFTILGLIILVGLIGKNSILIVDFANKLQQQSLSAKEAITESIKLRFRPVIMTSLVMIIGLLPIALSKGAGAEWKNGMAWALIGGLSSSLMLTFFVVPIIYLGINRIFKKYEND